VALLGEEFRIAKLTVHSVLRRRAASRLALPCTSSCLLSIAVRRVCLFVGWLVRSCVQKHACLETCVGPNISKTAGVRLCYCVTMKHV